MRRGFNTLAAQAEKVLDLDPYSGHLFVFRGRRGDLLKIIPLSHMQACVAGQWVGPTRRMPVQQAAGEGPFCLARRKGRQDQCYASTIVDAAGRDRLAYAAKDMASAEGRIGQ